MVSLSISIGQIRAAVEVRSVSLPLTVLGEGLRRDPFCSVIVHCCVGSVVRVSQSCNKTLKRTSPALATL